MTQKDKYGLWSEFKEKAVSRRFPTMIDMPHPLVSTHTPGNLSSGNLIDNSKHLLSRVSPPTGHSVQWDPDTFSMSSLSSFCGQQDVAVLSFTTFPVVETVSVYTA